MRLFTAILLSEEIKSRLYEAAQGMKRSGISCRPSARDNLHLTLIFLGEHDIKGLDDIKSAMNCVKSRGFTLSVDGLGAFRRGDGGIIWAGADGGEGLRFLRSSLSRALEDKGFAAEERFTPHITLCRDARGLPPSLDAFWEPSALSMEVKRVSLMKSEHINGRLTYTEIYSVPLA